MLAASIHEHAGLGNQIWQLSVEFLQIVLDMIMESVIQDGEVNSLTLIGESK